MVIFPGPEIYFIGFQIKILISSGFDCSSLKDWLEKTTSSSSSALEGNMYMSTIWTTVKQIPTILGTLIKRSSRIRPYPVQRNPLMRLLWGCEWNKISI